MSYWDAQGDMPASEDAVRESREGAAQVIGASAPQVTHYEVLLDVQE